MENSSDSVASEQEIRDFLNNCDLGQYADVLIGEGFDQLKSLFEIIESDLEALDIRRGHRRLLQRAIATARGYDPNLPLPTTSYVSSRSSVTSSTGSPNYNSNGRHLPPANSSRVGIRTETVSSTEEDNCSEFVRSKRKYRRHAKTDKNAPVKPPSAYVMFSNHVRSELKDYNMSFTDLAKIVGDRWKSISPEEKEQYDRTALKAKEEYLEALAKYEKSDDHKEYQRYLLDFKMKQQAAARAVGKPIKRAKNASPSSGSIADASNTSNGNNGDTSSSSNGNSVSVSNEHSTPTMPSTSNRSDAASVTTTDSGIFSISSSFEPYRNGECVSSSVLTSISSSDHSRSISSYPLQKHGRNHHPHNTSQLGHRLTAPSGESSETRSASDYSQFTGSSASNFSPSKPYETLPVSTPLKGRQPKSKDPSKSDSRGPMNPSMVGVLSPESPGLYQKQSIIPAEHAHLSSPRFPPLHNPAAKASKRDNDASSLSG